MMHNLKAKLSPLYEKGLLIDEKNFDEYLNTFQTSCPKPTKSFWSDRKVLITGAGGFVGSNVIKELLGHGSKVIGIVRHHDMSKYPNLLDIKNEIKIHVCDLTDYSHIDEIIREETPEIIFHYASSSFVPTSLSEPNLVFQNNVGSTINILKAGSKNARVRAIYTALSSEQYGYANLRELPIKEEQPFRATSPYSASKIATEYIGESFYHNERLPVLKIRTFNQEGVGDPEAQKRARDDRFFTMVVAKQIAEYLEEKRDKIIIQNPAALRDFTHVRDSVAAHLMAVEKCEPNEPYNVCSGHGILTGDFVKIACELHDIDTEIYCDIDKFRPYELSAGHIHGFVGDNTKFKIKTGWNPTLSIKDIITESVNYQRAKLK